MLTEYFDKLQKFHIEARYFIEAKSDLVSILEVLLLHKPCTSMYTAKVLPINVLSCGPVPYEGTLIC